MVPAGIPLAKGQARGQVRFLGPDPTVPPTVLAVPAWAAAALRRSPGVVGLLVEGARPLSLPELGIPAVGDVDGDVLREGEIASVDGDQGVFHLDGVQEVDVVTAFLRREDGRVLLLRRSERVRTFRGKWAAVSGYLERDDPLAQAFQEVREETGLRSDQLQLRARGERVLARDGSTIFVVRPFLFDVGASEIRTDWEHTAAEWVEPGELGGRETVPKLERAWESVSGALAREKS